MYMVFAVEFLHLGHSSFLRISKTRGKNKELIIKRRLE